MFSFSCSSVEEPDRMVTTSGMSSRKRNAQLAGDSSGLTAARMPACASVRRQSDAAAQRLHDPHGDAALGEHGDLLLAVLERPVQVVDLQLAELHVVAVGVQEALQHVRRAMAGEAQVADAAVLHLLAQVAHRAVLLVVQVRVDVELAHVVHQVEVEVPDLAFAQLLFEDLCVSCPCWPGRSPGTCRPGRTRRAGGRPARGPPPARSCRRGSPRRCRSSSRRARRRSRTSRARRARRCRCRRRRHDRQAHGAHGHGGELLALEVAVDHAESILSRLGRSLERSTERPSGSARAHAGASPLFELFPIKHPGACSKANARFRIL